MRGALRPVTEENTRIRREISQGEPAKRLSVLADYAMYQIEEYYRHGFELAAIVGANRSPTAELIPRRQRRRSPRNGLYMSALRSRLDAEGISIPMIGVKSDEEAVKKLQEIL